MAYNCANIYKAADTLTIVMDGLTGKINSADCYQSKRDIPVIGFLSKAGIKCCQEDDDCACFRSTCTLNTGSFGISRFKLGFEAIAVTCHYKLCNDGTLKHIKAKATTCSKSAGKAVTAGRLTARAI